MPIPSLKDRTVIPERMDAPDLDPAAHAQALAGLRRLNRAANVTSHIAPPILRFARHHSLQQLTLLDVACGGGDVSVGIAQSLQAAGIQVALTLMDMSPTALQQAAARAAAAHVTAHICQGTAPTGLPTRSFDVVINTLFLHHLSREDVVETLRQMNLRAQRLLIVCDLRRGLAGYLLAQLMCRLLSRSPIVHFDGPVSVRAAWTPDELRVMAHDAALTATIRPCFPARMKLIAEKSYVP